MAETELRQAALGYAAQGWKVFPCRAGAKTPMTEHGVKDATSDPAQIQRWWTQTPNANIGLACGSSGLVVVDVDGRHGGFQSWAALKARHGIDDATLTSLTGGGGWHLIYQAPGDLDARNSAGLLGPGLDVRANGGYIVVPPSLHPSGSRYAWDADRPVPIPLPDSLRRLLERKPSPRAPAPAGLNPGNGYGAAALRQELDDLARAAEGTRNDRLNRAAFALGQLVAGGELARLDVERGLRAVALAIGLSEAEAVRTIASGLASGMSEPRMTPEPARQPLTGHRADEPPPRPDLTPTEPGWLAGDDLAEQIHSTPGAAAAATAEPRTWEDMAGMIGPVAWEWPGYLPSAFLMLLVADSGIGKSNLALRIAQTYLTGAPWPDGTPYIGEPGKVLWCEAEAAQALNLGRAKDWGLPCNRILSPMQNPLDDVNLLDHNHRAAIAAIASRDDVRMIVVDSLSGACAGKEKGEDQAPVVKWLAELARNVGKPVLVLHHLRKRGMLDGGEVVTLDRVRGSTVIVQLARMVWALDNPDPNDAEHRRFAVIKSNLARFPDALGLRIGDNGLTFDDAPQVPRTEMQIDKAVDLLNALLDSGPLPSTKIETEARGAGISWDTMTRAQKKLGVVARRDGKQKVWTWALPARIAE